MLERKIRKSFKHCSLNPTPGIDPCRVPSASGRTRSGAQDLMQISFDEFKSTYGESIKRMNTTSIHDNMVKGCFFAYLKLTSYYSKTGTSDIYPVATALDPSYSFSYWKSENWGEPYETQAEEAVKNAWKKYNPNAANEASNQYNTPIPDEFDEQDDSEEEFDYEQQVRYVRRKIVHEQSQNYTENFVDQLDMYVKAAPLQLQQHQVFQQSQSVDQASEDDILWWERGLEESHGLNPISRELMFWKTASVTGSSNLANMASDYLSVVASSSSCERVFSRSKRFITNERNRLTSENVKNMMLLSYWVDEIDNLESI